MVRFSCAPAGPCDRSANMGWRYLLFAMGGLTLAMFGLRFFVFTMHESPKFLMGRGDDAGAARVVAAVARRNGADCSFVLGDLKALDGDGCARTGAAEAVRRKMRVFNAAHVRALFRTRELARSTATIIVLWFLIVGASAGFAAAALMGAHI